MKELSDLYQQILNLQTATFALIEHEDAMVATVYQVIKPDGKALILKISERAADHLREVHFLKQFASSIRVPEIIQIVEPSKQVHGAILMECLPGTLLKEEELNSALSHELGQNLAIIHQSRLFGYGDPIQGVLSADPRTYFTMRFEEGLEECRDHLPRELIEKSKRFYEANSELLMSVDGPCVAHRDYRPANLMVHEGKLQGIIDWAGARASFAEEDFCSIEHGNWLQNPQAKDSFLSGYQIIRPIPDYEHLIPLLRLNKAIATIGFMVKRRTWDNTNSAIYHYNRQFLENFF